MPTLPIQLNGGFYESRTRSLSVQNSTNMYLEFIGENQGSTPAALLSWPGKKAFAASVSATNRGMFNEPWKNHVYTVNGTSLYKTNSSGTQASVGTIPGSARCVFAASTSFLYIVTLGKVYRTDGSTVAEVTDGDLEDPDSVAFLNSQLIYDGDGGRFVVSDAGDGSSINSLNYATAETHFDDLVRVYVFGQLLLLFGDKTLETWYNSGEGNPPYTRYEGAQRPVGIAGVHCITNTDDAVYFLGDDRTVYRLDGYNPIQISTPAINHAIEQYTTTSDCFAHALKIEGQFFVIFTFPTEDKTWCFSQSTGVWIQLSSGVSGGRDLANGHCFAFNKNLVVDKDDGAIYELDVNTYDDNGATFIRERTTAPAYSGQITESDKEVFYSAVKLVINSGAGLVTGQGSDPQVMLSYSDDLGQTWSPELFRDAGANGAYGQELYWYALGAAKQRVFRIRVSDPIEFHLLRMEAEVEIGI